MFEIGYWLQINFSVGTTEIPLNLEPLFFLLFTYIPILHIWTLLCAIPEGERFPFGCDKRSLTSE